MGSVTPYDTKAGKRYRARYRDPDNRQHDKWGFATKKSAELFLASVEVSKARGEFVDVGAAKATVAELGPGWLANQSHLKPSSLRPVEIAWRKYVEPKWGSKQIGDIRHSDVQSWVTTISRGKSASTVIRAYGVLAGLLDVAVKDRRILSNPARGVKLPKRQHREHIYLSHTQVRDLAQGSGDHAALVLLLAYTGLRWGEAIALRARDVDLNKRRLTISINAVEVGGEIEIGTPKTHKRRSVPFPKLLEAHLEQALKGKSGEDLVFSDEWGQHLRRTRVSGGSRSWFKTALKDAGLEPMTLHDLRHTAASLSISAGANVKAVQRMLGHASAAMTLDVYAELFDDDLNAVSDRLDEAYNASIVGEMWGNSADNTKTPAQSQ